MKSKIKIIIGALVLIILIIIISVYAKPIFISRGNSFLGDDSSSMLASANYSKRNNHQKRTRQPVVPIDISSFSENFNTDFSVTESGSIEESSNKNWWISSGAYLNSAGGLGNTIMGKLSIFDPWRVAFSISNPIDTDDGYYPQNIFRLVLKSKWQNFQQEAYFKIINDNLSVSPNRNASNGLLLFNRYQDAFNLYYTGVRVDGYAVIKKKINGEYYTMAYKPFINGSVYDKDNNPNLLPKNTWIGLRSEVTNNADKTVTIKLYTDNGKTGNWVLVAEAKDDGKIYGGPVISSEGYAGIRTDFMDVSFEDYKITKQ